MKKVKQVKVPPGHEGHERMELAARILSSFVLSLAADAEVCPICLVEFFAGMVAEAERDGKISHGQVVPPDGDGTDLFDIEPKATMQ